MPLKIEYVGFIPENLDAGTLYISREYSTAMHLCPCGCGGEVATRIHELLGWTLKEVDGKVTLSPSISNQFSCRSHYWIVDNKIVWAE